MSLNTFKRIRLLRNQDKELQKAPNIWKPSYTFNDEWVREEIESILNQMKVQRST